jgi:hypothetical protein
MKSEDLSESIHRYLPHPSSTKLAEMQCKDHHHSLATSPEGSAAQREYKFFSLHGIEDDISSARLRILWLVRRAQKRTFTIEMIL